MRIYMLRRYHERMQLAKSLLGGKCARCGSTNSLEIDHKNWYEKAYDIAKLWSFSKERFETELVKCQLLCSACHKKKTKADVLEILKVRGLRSFNSLPENAYIHGTPRMRLYRKCECTPCLKAGWLYRRGEIKIADQVLIA